MLTKSDLEPLVASNLAGFQVCAAYLNCILMQSTAGRPLSPEEIGKAAEVAIIRVTEGFEQVLQQLRGQTQQSSQ